MKHIIITRIHWRKSLTISIHVSNNSYELLIIQIRKIIGSILSK